MFRPEARTGRLHPLHELAAVRGLFTDRLGTLARLAREHPEGAVVHLPRGRLVVVSSPAAVQHVLVTNADAYTKGMGQAEAAPLLGDGLLTAEGETWRAQRRAVTGRLRARRIHELTPRIAEHARSSVADLRTEHWRTVRPARPLAAYTLECLASTLGFAAPDPDVVMESFETIQREAMFATSTRSLVPLAMRPRARARVRAAQDRLSAEIARVLPDGPGRHPEPTSRDAMVSLLLAGYETTASTLGWALRMLADDHALQRTVAQEAASRPDVLRGEAPASELTLARDLFRRTAVRHPPVWLISRRARQPDVVDGVRVRAGDDVAISLHAVHASDDPATGTPACRPGSEAREMPFGGGPRGCPGGSLAETEGVLWIAHACRALQLETTSVGPPHAHARMSYGLDPSCTVRVRGRRPDAQPAGVAPEPRRSTIDAA